jgi:hypothetical protein
MPTVTILHKGSEEPWTWTNSKVAVSIVEAAANHAMETGETLRLPDRDIPGADILGVKYEEGAL